MNTMTIMPQNYRKQVDWVFSAYESAGVSLPDGFQKDAIQNAVGARKYNKWENWKCDIYCIKNEKGVFLVIEDSGTLGLIGRNMSTDEINDFAIRGESLPPNERLARFSSMNNSGGNDTGGGLYGVGKSVYSVSSVDYCYYFDSLREDGTYVANMNNAGQIYRKAFENEEAKKFILLETGLLEKKDPGTRVIIKNPKKEIVQSIESGEMESYIQESWWIIIRKFKGASYIALNHNPIIISNDYFVADRCYESKNPIEYKPGYRVKNFGLFLFENGKNQWHGISYYRKGMKIGELDLDVIPEKVRNKFWGYIEVDEEWERELAEIEDSIHFGVSKNKKRSNTYQYLKIFVSTQFKRLMMEWGYIKDSENQAKKLKEELEKIAENLQDIFDELGFEDFGKGTKKTDFDVRWNNIMYPIEGSEKVLTDDEIHFSMRIKSSYLTNKKFSYSIVVMDEKKMKIASTIDEGNITVNSNTIYEKDFVFKVKHDNSFRYEENRIILKVSQIGSNKEKIKELPFFYDIDKPVIKQNRIILTLHSCSFPTELSKRVNFGDIIRDVSYRIDNKQNFKLHYKLNISIHNLDDPSNIKIIDIGSFKGVINSYEEEVITVPDILINKDEFEKITSKGRLQLRARLSASEYSGIYEKGDKITHFYYDFFLNMDDKNGKRNSFEIKCLDNPEDYRRAWHEIIGTRTIYLNIGHRAYKRLAEYNELQNEYMSEQMLRQYVMMYLSEGQFNMFKVNDEDFIELDPVKATEKVVDVIEELYHASVNR